MERTLFSLVVGCALVLGAARVARPESAPAVDAGAAPAPAAPGDTTPRDRRTHEAPESMVLCRGPRGAVYARDLGRGCRYTRLDASNLVDFGAGGDCLLRRAASLDPEGETTSGVRGCQDVCAAVDDDRICVVGVQRVGDDWTTFTAAERFPAGDPALREASIVCCAR